MDTVKKAPNRKPQWKRELERMLQLYPLYKRSQFLLPSLVSYQAERVDGGDKQYSATERLGIKRAEQQQLIDSIDYALSSLSPIERRVIEETYFPTKTPVDVICDRLYCSQRKYRYLKQRALSKMAWILSLI